MAFEDAFGNIDFMAPTRARQQEASQLQQLLGQVIANNQQMQLKKAEIEAKGNEFNLKRQAETALYKKNLGIPVTPEDEAAIATMSQIAPPVYTTDAYGNPVARPSGWSGVPTNRTQGIMPEVGTSQIDGFPAIGGASMASPQEELALNQMMGQPAPMPSPDTRLSVDQLGRQGIEIPPISMDDLGSGNVPYNQPQDVVSVDDTYKAPAEFGAKGRIMEEEFKKESLMAEKKADIQFRKEQMKTEKGREKVTGTIKKTMEDLERLNDELKAKEAIITNDSDTLSNLKTKYGTSIVGRWTGSVTKPKIEALRKEYEVKRDSVIPSYIAYFNIPATVVDTEEMQKRILQSFGDPSLSFEANQAALENMRVQFNLPKERSEAAQTNQGWSIKRK